MKIRVPVPVNIPKTLTDRVQDPIGGVESTDSLFKRVLAAHAGIRDRIRGMDQPTMPSVYPGRVVFRPETQSFPLDTNQDGVSSNPVNYVLRSGQNYEVPVLVGGDGVFMAHAVHIAIWQRFFVGAPGIMAPADMPVSPIQNQFDAPIAWTTKFSLYPVQPAVGKGTLRQCPCLNYAWNVQDPISGVMYSDAYLPATAAGNRTFLSTGGPITPDPTGTQPQMHTDGFLHYFDSPWRFDQAQQIILMIRPTTDIVQFDSSLAGTNAAIGLPWDDRESGVRNQSVTIQAEFIGERVGGSA